MPPRILFVTNTPGFFLSHRLAVAEAARAHGYDVQVASPAGGAVARIHAAGFPWHEIDMQRSVALPHRELGTARDFYRLYRRLKPTLVYHATPKPVLYGSVAARLARVPVVVNAITGMGYVYSQEHSLARRLLRASVSAAYRLALRHRRMRVVFENPDHRSLFVQRGWIAPEQALLIHGSGVDTQRFAPRAFRPPGRPLVLLASRMLWGKGVAELVEAAKQLVAEGVDARFVLVGGIDPDSPDGIPEAQLQAWQASGAIEYWGRRDDMPQVMAGADVVCMPSSYSEGIPTALMEAAAAGVPIVTTDTPGCRDVVRDGENGFLVPVKSPGAVADALRALLRDPALRARQGTAGRCRALANFSVERVVAEHLALFEELLGTPG